MHACFHGGGQGSGRTIRIIRDLTKNMKAMSLKVKAGGGGGHARARRRRRRRGSGAEAEDGLEMQDKDIATAAAAAAAPSSSAKIAPEEERGGKRQAQKCDKCRSVLDDVAEEEVKEEEGTAGEAADHAAGEESDGEWVAEPEPGVLMTLVPRPDGTNHLRKLRFRGELFDGPRAAQRWWEDNYDSIVELYSIVQSGGGSHNDDDGGGAEDLEDDEPATPCQSEDDHHQQRRRWQRLGFDSASTSGGPSSGSGSGSGNGSGSGGGSASTVGSPILGLVLAGPNSSKIGRGPGQARSPKHKCRSLHIN